MAEVKDADLIEARRLWETERTERPIPVSVRFDPASERVIVDFANGAAVQFPARAVEGLQQASAEELAEVELLGETGLHWETLDVDYSISGLMRGIFGSRHFLAAQRRGGQSRSPAKTAAARANGMKGGRPGKKRA